MALPPNQSSLSLLQAAQQALGESGDQLRMQQLSNLGAASLQTLSDTTSWFSMGTGGGGGSGGTGQAFLGNFVASTWPETKSPTKKQQALIDKYEALVWGHINNTDQINRDAIKEAVANLFEYARLDCPKIKFHRGEPEGDESKGLFDTYFKTPMREDIFSKGYVFNEAETLYNETIGSEDNLPLDVFEFRKRQEGGEGFPNPILERVALLEALCRETFHVRFTDRVVHVWERPSKINWDEEKRLHCENGPAIKFRSGKSIHIWHGTEVPRNWIERGVDANTALTWKNTEERRCACEIAGWHNILEELNAITINKDEDPMVGELVEVEMPFRGGFMGSFTNKEKFLRVMCGTGREFAIPVPSEMKTALEANAWTYGVDPVTIKQLEHRT